VSKGGGFIMPSDPRFFELPPPPGSEPSLEERLARLTSGEDEENLPEPDEAVAVVAGSVDAHVAVSSTEDIAAYDRHRRRLPFDRAVLVQAHPGATGRARLVDGLQTLGIRDKDDTDLARGVAIVTPDTSDGELRDLDAAGVKVVRFPMLEEDGPLNWEDLGGIASRVKDILDWDVSLRMDGRYLAEVETMIQSWPGRVILEGFGCFLKPVGDKDNGMRALLRLMDRDKLWVSLAGEDRVSLDGAPRYRDLQAITEQLAAFAPERLVWGSDWPRQTDAAESYERLGEWLQDDWLRRRIVIGNPTELFRFTPVVVSNPTGVNTPQEPTSNTRR
jgi:D-galactarolactone isomerase